MRLHLSPGTAIGSAIVGLILIASALVWRIQYFETQVFNTQKRSEVYLASVESALAALQEKVDALLSANQSVSMRLEEERVKRLAAEAERLSETTRANQKISALEQEVAGAKAPDVSAIISQWRPRVASVRCHWDLPNGNTKEDAGSGVLMAGGATPTLFTNRHVVTYLGVTASYCTVQFPGETVLSVVYAKDLHPSPNGIDWAKIELTKPTPYVQALAGGSTPRCTTRASVGEAVIILGYPAIGARDDVTATEGIISGYEDDYFIASAKVERGNSGGAAIATKQNCFLGTPTYVGAGQLETLARILDQKVIPQ